MPPILDAASVLGKLSSLPVEVHEQGRVVLAAGTTTGKLLVLKQGAVEVRRDGIRLAEVSEPGAVFGELAILLGQPHTADVLTLEPSTFYCAAGETFLRIDPTAALYVAMVLAHRVHLVNHHLIEARSQLGKSQGVFDEMVSNIAEAIRYGPPL